jgi:hypothetical protein
MVGGGFFGMSDLGSGVGGKLWRLERDQGLETLNFQENLRLYPKSSIRFTFGQSWDFLAQILKKPLNCKQK